MNKRIKQIFLILGDIIILYLSLYLALLIRYGSQPTPQIWQSHLLPFSIIFIGWLLIFYISDLYNLTLAINNAKFFQLTLRSVLIAGALAAIFFYVNPNIGIAPKTNLAIFLFIFSLFFFFWRRIFNWILKSYLPKNNIIIIGWNTLARELVDFLQKNSHLGFRPAAVISSQTQSIAGVKIINNTDNLRELAIKEKISTIILVSDPHQSDSLRASLFSCLPLKINFISLPNFYESITGKIPIEAVNQMWFLENLSESKKIWFDQFKKIYDFLIALFLFLLTLPFWLIIALIIKFESHGPIFYLSSRVGRNNKIFNLIKFRTMREEENDRSPTRANDPRVTKFGRFLRRTRIDEIPQVINILKGELSFIGPRPERPEIVKEREKEIPFYKERLLVKPGATGWDQVSGEYHSPSKEDTLKKLQYDLFYIKNRSIYLDLSIVLKTVATILRRGGI